MIFAQSSLARIENSLGKRKLSPLLATLRRHAKGCGKKLAIQIGSFFDWKEFESDTLTMMHENQWDSVPEVSLYSVMPKRAEKS